MTITDVLDALNVKYITSGNEHCTAGWVQLDCTDCTPDSNRFRLGINLAHGNASCWACGPKKTYQVLAAAARTSPGKVVELLKQFKKTGLTHAAAPRSGRYAVPFPVGPLLSAHKRYLHGRDYIPAEVSKLWSVQGIGWDGGSHRWRLFLPVVLYGKPVSWTTRSISDAHATRYRSAKAEQEDVPHKHTVYGFDYVRSSCLVVEGPTGCWRVGPGCVGTFGTRWTPEQVAMLAQVPKRYVMFDPEPEAQAQAERLCDRLGGYAGTTELVRLPEGTDPGTLTPKQVRQVRRWLV